MEIKHRHSCSKTESVCFNFANLRINTHAHKTRRHTEMDTVNTLTLPIYTLYLGPRPRRWSASLWGGGRPAQSPQQQRSPPSQTLNGRPVRPLNLQPQMANKEQGCKKSPCFTPPVHTWCPCMVF